MCTFVENDLFRRKTHLMCYRCRHQHCCHSLPRREVDSFKCATNTCYPLFPSDFFKEIKKTQRLHAHFIEMCFIPFTHIAVSTGNTCDCCDFDMALRAVLLF
jgi:hypothetical protein